MGPCGGKQKQPDPKQQEIALKKQKITDLQQKINDLHLQVLQKNQQIAYHELKKEIDKQKTKEWGIYINKVERDKLQKQIESLKEELQNEKLFGSLPQQYKQEYIQQRALNTLR